MGGVSTQTQSRPTHGGGYLTSLTPQFIQNFLNVSVGLPTVVYAHVIKNQRSLAFSITRGEAEKLRKVGYVDRMMVLVREMGTGITFQGTLRNKFNAYVIRIPVRLSNFFIHGSTVIITIIPIAVKENQRPSARAPSERDPEGDPQ